MSVCTASRSELGMQEQQPPQKAVKTSTKHNPSTTQNIRASQPSILSMHVAIRTPVLLQTAKLKCLGKIDDPRLQGSFLIVEYIPGVHERTQCF